MASPDPSVREGGLLALAIISEGCTDLMRRKLKELLPFVIKGLTDPCPGVLGASAFALGQFSEHLHPEVLDHYREVLPTLFLILQQHQQHQQAVGLDASIMERVCYALDAFCSCLEEEVIPYLPQLVNVKIWMCESVKMWMSAGVDVWRRK